MDSATAKTAKGMRPNKMARPTKKQSQLQVDYFATGDPRNNTEYPQALCPCFERVGNMHIVWERKDAEGKKELMVVIGPSWPTMVCITLPLIVLFSYFVSCTLLVEDDVMVKRLYWAFTCWVCICLVVVAFSDPGLVPYYPRPPPGGSSWPYSQQAGSYRPLRALFSKECNVIIEEYDHTCPWTGTAIGKKNIKAFKVFLISLAALLILDVMLVVYRQSARSPAVIVFGVLLIAFIAVGLWCCMSSSAHHTSREASSSSSSSIQVTYGAIPSVDQLVERSMEQEQKVPRSQQLELV